MNSCVICGDELRSESLVCRFCGSYAWETEWPIKLGEKIQTFNLQVQVEQLTKERDLYRSCHFAGHSSLYVTHNMRGVDRRASKRWKRLAKRLRVRLKAHDDLVKACKKLQLAYDEQVTRTREIQLLAAEARRTRSSLTHKINDALRVFNVQDTCESILEALEKLEESS